MNYSVNSNSIYNSVTFPSYILYLGMLEFMIGKKPMHEVRLGYCLILCPLVWQCPILGLYATHLIPLLKFHSMFEDIYV